MEATTSLSYSDNALAELSENSHGIHDKDKGSTIPFENSTSTSPSGDAPHANIRLSPCATSLGPKLTDHNAVHDVDPIKDGEANTDHIPGKDAASVKHVAHEGRSNLVAAK